MKNEILKALLRKIVGHKEKVIGSCNSQVLQNVVEVLECGHWLNIKTDIYGETNASRRRCWKCMKGYPKEEEKDAKEKNM